MSHPRVRLVPLSCPGAPKMASLSNRRVELWMSGEVEEPCGGLVSWARAHSLCWTGARILPVPSAGDAELDLS